MALIFWWMLVLWAIAIAAYWSGRYYLLKRRKSRRATDYVPAAHTNRLTSMPEYQVVLRQYRRLVVLAAGLLTLGLLTGILLTSRPAKFASVVPVQPSRDIMLCMDASGSVLREDAAITDFFSAIVKNFSGQRFGLTLFNSSAVTVIPLNDDYPLITQQLKSVAQAFRLEKGQNFDVLTDGTLADFSSGTSLAGDGLASCMQQLGSNLPHHSQSIILATDNEAYGKSIVSMTQDQTIAKRDGIQVYVIDPGISDPKLAGDHAELKIIAKQTGGSYYLLKAGSIGAIINSISAQESSLYVGAPQPAHNDNPKLFIYVMAVITIISLGLIWWLEL